MVNDFVPCAAATSIILFETSKRFYTFTINIEVFEIIPSFQCLSNSYDENETRVFCFDCAP